MQGGAFFVLHGLQYGERVKPVVAQGRFGFAERTESAARITQLALSFVLVDGASSALMSKWVSLCVMVVNSPHQNGCFGLDEFLGGSIRFVATEVAS